ncbi:hypothetical protein [Streptomyces anulatus]|uniref:hypothetical protein n=1 Tax=Streptomyces anulatus TaxID=1892 RepID=UPI00255CCA9D|nr:hypothetical protein [Streptomyces anulatus]WIY75970.1 hypothetical protein QPM16_09905 [Streptomyces anulatus]
MAAQREVTAGGAPTAERSAAARQRRAMASLSLRMTELTPGRTPAAVTQCTASVGTPKANLRGCARWAWSSRWYGLRETATPPVSWNPPSPSGMRYGAHCPARSSPRSNGSVVVRTSGSVSRASISAETRIPEAGPPADRRTNPSLSGSGSARRPGRHIRTTPASTRAISSSMRRAGGPIERYALRGVYQARSSSRYERPLMPPWSTTSRISFRRSRSTSRAAFSGLLTLPFSASDTSPFRWPSSHPWKARRSVNFRSP